jgi:hypothetical protein
MATTYNVHFVNNTKEAYHFAIYQKYPEAPGLKSVAFQVRGVPANGKADATWNMTFGTAITDFDPNGKNWTGQQIQNAQLGKQYEIKMVEGDIPTIDANPTGSASNGIILLRNATNRSLNVGFTIDRSLIAVQEVHGGETSEYYVHPTYYVAVYRNIKKGSMVDSGVVIGPVELKFADGYTSYSVEAAIDGGQYVLKDPVPVPT